MIQSSIIVLHKIQQQRWNFGRTRTPTHHWKGSVLILVKFPSLAVEVMNDNLQCIQCWRFHLNDSCIQYSVYGLVVWCSLQSHLGNLKNVIKKLDFYIYSCISCLVHSLTQKCHFLWNFYHWLYLKLSFWQLPVQLVMKILSKWWHFHSSVFIDIFCAIRMCLHQVALI